MFKRFVLVLLPAVVVLTALPVPAATAASSPWWQVLTGSRPTNLWEPKDGEMEIETSLEELFGEEVAAAQIKVDGVAVGCLGVQSPTGALACEFTTGFTPTETAAQLETLLNTALGPEAVKVVGGPVGGEPFKITSDGAVPDLTVSATEPPVGTATLKVLSPGGSGRLVLTITNLGDAPVDATENPVVITDELPEGMEAAGVEGFAGAQSSAGPVDCSVEASDLVSCTFEGELPSYEAIEVEIIASLIGEPPSAGAPGKVTVSGGDAPSESVVQEIKVSPEKTPFGIEYFSAKAEAEGGVPATQAGGHPLQFSTTIQFNSGELSPGATRRETVVEQPAVPRNLRFPLPAGLVGAVAERPRCKMTAFLNGNEGELCPDEAAIGVVSLTIIENVNVGLVRMAVPLFNLPPAPGEPARFGITPVKVPVVIETEVDPDNRYRIIGKTVNAPQTAQFLASTVTIWGAPGEPRHDDSRGWSCLDTSEEAAPCERPPNLSEQALLRLPVSCVTPFDFEVQLEPWNVPQGSVVEEAQSTGGTMSGCNQVPFNPTIVAAPQLQAGRGRERSGLSTRDAERRPAEPESESRRRTGEEGRGDAAGRRDRQPVAGGRPWCLPPGRLRAGGVRLATRRRMPGGVKGGNRRHHHAAARGGSAWRRLRGEAVRQPVRVAAGAVHGGEDP